MASPRLHPAAIWLPLVVALVAALGWALFRDPSPPNPAVAGTGAPESTGETEAHSPEASVATSDPVDTPPNQGRTAPTEQPATESEPDSNEEVAPTDLPAADRALNQAQAALKQKKFGEARREALACLKVDPGNIDCKRARVHSYTQQYSMTDTKNILGWCLSAFASDLNCLRAMREFHVARGEGMDASGISAEIRDRFPDEDLTMPALPSATDPPPSE